MGAYIALLIGAKLNVGKIIAFGPQIIINQYFPNNPKDDSYIIYKDLTSIIDSSESHIDIFFGMNDILDIYYMQSIKEKNNVNVYKVFGQPHNVMYYLLKLNILGDYIESKIFNKSYDINISTQNSVENFTNLEKAIELFFIKKDYRAAQNIFEELIKKYPNINTFWKYCAISHYHQKNYQEALKYFESANLIVYRDDELHYFLGLSYFMLKEYKKAIKEFRYTLEISIDKKMGYFIKLAVSLRELELYEEALDVLEESLDINRKNFGTYFQFAQIYKRKGDTTKAIENLKTAKELNPKNEAVEKELQELSRLI